jgi:hypothetical protein
VADPKLDTPRLLASRSEQGYTTSAFESMHDEPEAITADEQKRMTAAVHHAEAERLRQEWKRTEQAVDGELDRFVNDSGVHVTQRVFSGVRAVKRAARAVGARVEVEAEQEMRA